MSMHEIEMLLYENGTKVSLKWMANIKLYNWIWSNRSEYWICAQQQQQVKKNQIANQS